jgi:hypothetical protein
MASGKQVSFSYGEISQSIQYKSNAVAFGEGLAQLTNAYVRSEGGFSNRIGFKYLATLESNVTDPGLLYQNQKSRLLSAILDDGDQINRLQYGMSRIFRFINPTYVEGFSPVSSGSFKVLLPDGAFSNVGAGIKDLALFPAGERSVGGDPRKAQLVQIGEDNIVTFGDCNSAVRNYLYNIRGSSGSYNREPFKVIFYAVTGFTLSGGTNSCTGNAPVNLPVHYLIMTEFEDGSEKYITDSAGAGHPHSTASGRIQYSTFTYPNDLKSLNIYRSAGSINSAFALVGKVPINDNSIATVDFYDYVIVGDISNAPPINPRLWGKQYGAAPATNFREHFALRAARRVMSYQQRLFAFYDPNENIDMEEGTVGVSKLGVPQQLHSPDIYNSVDAFEFKLPIAKGSKVLFAIPMERALIFTNSSVIMLRGSGEQGFITPTEVNPAVIFYEGSSETITPVVSGNYCFFVSNDHKKIYGVNTKGNEYQVGSISDLSSHLLNIDVVEMEITRGVEDILWILRRDGKVVACTFRESGFGFSLHETDGLITSIAKFTRPPEFNIYGEWATYGYLNYHLTYPNASEECLAVQVLRDINGQRNLYLESLVPRIDEDSKEEGFTYMDSFKHFGARLSLNQGGKYVANNPSEYINLNDERPNLNIEGGTTYEAGEALEITSTVSFTDADDILYIDFYYDQDIEDERDGGTRTIKRTIRFERNGVAVDNTPGWTIPGFFHQDVPAILQDVTAQNPSNKNALQTRYCLPVRNISVPHLAGEEVSVFADGQVLSSPNNPDPNKPATLTVAVGGTLDLGDYYGYAVVGLPYTMTMQSLDIEPADNRTLTDSNKCISAIGVALENTRGGYFASSGAKLDNSRFQALEYRDSENMDDPDRNYSGYANIPIQSSWDNRGRAAIRQYDPLPISVLSIYPKGVSSGE